MYMHQLYTNIAVRRTITVIMLLFQLFIAFPVVYYILASKPTISSLAQSEDRPQFAEDMLKEIQCLKTDE